RGVREDVAFIDARNMLARGKHRHDGFGAGDRLGRRSRTNAAGVHGARQRLFAEIERADVMSRLRQIRGHPAAHVTESDKGDFHNSSNSSRMMAIPARMKNGPRMNPRMA